MLVHGMLVHPPHAEGWELEQHGISGTHSGGQEPPLQHEDGQLSCCKILQSSAPEPKPEPEPEPKTPAGENPTTAVYP